MTWSTLPSYSDGSAFTAAMALAMRDNINESAAARATTATGYFVATGTHSLAERLVAAASVLTQETDTLTSYGNISPGTAGPTTTVTTGIRALVFTSAQLENSGNGSTWASYEITGATTDAAIDDRAIFSQSGATFGGRFGVTTWQTLTAGSNTFTMKYRVSSGTGTFDDRRIIIMSL